MIAKSIRANPKWLGVLPLFLSLLALTLLASLSDTYVFNTSGSILPIFVLNIALPGHPLFRGGLSCLAGIQGIRADPVSLVRLRSAGIGNGGYSGNGFGRSTQYRDNGQQYTDTAGSRIIFD